MRPIHVGWSSVLGNEWTEKPVAIIGGGPSLKGADLGLLRDRFTVLAVNASIFDVPWADAGFSLDMRAMRNWWRRLCGLQMEQFYAVPADMLLNFPCEPSRRMIFMRRVTGTLFDSNLWHISCGGTSGYGALQLAFKRGAKKIVLFGFDYGPSVDGEWHHNEQHYTFFQRQELCKWREFAASFNAAVPVLKRAGVEVINASPGSAITAFPRVSFEEAIS